MTQQSLNESPSVNRSLRKLLGLKAPSTHSAGSATANTVEQIAEGIADGLAQDALVDDAAAVAKAALKERGVESVEDLTPEDAAEVSRVVKASVRDKLDSAGCTETSEATLGDAQRRDSMVAGVALAAVIGALGGGAALFSPPAHATGSAAAFAALFEVIMTALLEEFMVGAQEAIVGATNQTSMDQIKAVGMMGDAQIDNMRGIYDHQRRENARPAPTSCVTTATGAAATSASVTRRRRGEQSGSDSSKQMAAGVTDSAAFVVSEMKNRQHEFPTGKDVDAANFVGSRGYANADAEKAATAFIRRLLTITKANLVALPTSAEDRVRGLGYKSKHLNVAARALAAEQVLLDVHLRRKKNLSADDAIKQSLDREQAVSQIPEELEAVDDARELYEQMHTSAGLSELEVINFEVQRRLSSAGWRATLHTYTEPAPLLREACEMLATNNYLLLLQLEMLEQTAVMTAMQVLHAAGADAEALNKDYAKAATKPGPTVSG